MTRLFVQASRFVNQINLFQLIRRANGKVVDFQAHKDKKKQQEQASKYGLSSLFDLMDAGVLFGESSTINVDDMHRARAAANFPPVPAGAPFWLHATISAIDEPNPVKRKARFKRLSHSLSQATKDPLEKEKAQEEYKKDKEQELKEFVRAAKAGWLRFGEIESWADNYPLLFANLEYQLRDWQHAASDYLLTKYKLHQKTEKWKSVVPHDLDVVSLPVGTKLYLVGFYKKIHNINWIDKVDDDEWVSDRQTAGSDQYVRNRLEGNRDRTSPSLLWKPESEFELGNYQPSEPEIKEIIDYYLRHHPDKFIEAHGWEHDLELPDYYYLD